MSGPQFQLRVASRAQPGEVVVPAGEEVLGRRREHDLRLRADPVGDWGEYLRVEAEHADGVPADHPAGLVDRHLVGT